MLCFEKINFYRLSLIFILSISNLFAQDWKVVEPGYSIGEFTPLIKSNNGDSKITVIKIDPKLFKVDLYCQSDYGGNPRTVKRWGKEFDLVAAINAGMYATDYKTSIGYLKTGNHFNNETINKSHKSIFACNPKSENVPPVQIIDLQHQNFSKYKNKYHSFLQSIRMISSKQKNVWQNQPLKRYSIAALGIDTDGNLLLIHCRSTYTVHDFNNILLSLPLKLHNAMYLEGGPPASLFYKDGKESKELLGNYTENGIISGSNQVAWEIPNIIGIKRKTPNKKKK